MPDQVGHDKYLNYAMNLTSITPSRLLALIALSGSGMLAFGLYLQHVVGLNPCPMCIVQRYALIGVVLVAAVGLRLHGWGLTASGLLLALVSGFGGFTAARQSWLQWYPPEVVTCGRDFYGMVENFPINRAIPMIFKGSGDCTKIDWTFLGGSIANWSFVVFVAMLIWMVTVVWRKLGGPQQAANDDQFPPAH